MKIVDVKEQREIVYYIETDEDLYNQYRRDTEGNWERAMGESWEIIDGRDELEELFQDGRSTKRPEKPQMPPNRIIIRSPWPLTNRGICEKCRSSLIGKWYNPFKVLGCIQPMCENYAGERIASD